MVRQIRKGRCSEKREKHVQGKCEIVECALEDTGILKSALSAGGTQEELGESHIMKASGHAMEFMLYH